ncbi:MAG: hypothetical protein OHK0022_57880 [Roseiflexaceae bacterium]
MLGVPCFQTRLDIPTALMGFALPDDAMHSPNERFRLDQFARAITTCAAFLEQFGST